MIKIYFSSYGSKISLKKMGHIARWYSMSTPTKNGFVCYQWWWILLICCWGTHAQEICSTRNIPQKFFLSAIALPWIFASTGQLWDSKIGIWTFAEHKQVAQKSKIDQRKQCSFTKWQQTRTTYVEFWWTRSYLQLNQSGPSNSNRSLLFVNRTRHCCTAPLMTIISWRLIKVSKQKSGWSICQRNCPILI